ncbi:MAG: hypothetical protein Q4F71_00525 [Paracoccus sp. (in: a-proteobacteria)]|nr:hypothetical protein [Paracoccus sp. (in: a-proteobacteria)]
MTRYLTGPEAEAVAAYALDRLPTLGDTDGRLHHKHISAYQMACDLLEATGHGKAMDWGLVRFDPPRPPAQLPRWDDTATILIKLAGQTNEITFGHKPVEPKIDWRQGIVLSVADPPSRRAEPDRPPDLDAADGIPAAWVSGEIRALFSALGIREEDGWSHEARSAVWRAGHYGAECGFQDDPLFTRTIARSRVTVPASVLAERDRLRARQFRNPLMFGWELDWCFFDRWRLGDGWLDDAATARAIPVFNDDVAIAARQIIFGDK